MKPYFTIFYQIKIPLALTHSDVAIILIMNVSMPTITDILTFMSITNLIGPGPEVIKLFSYSTQLSTKFIMLINVKMPTIVGILTFISMINTTFERLKARNFLICRNLAFICSWNFLLS